MPTYLLLLPPIATPCLLFKGKWLVGSLFFLSRSNHGLVVVPSQTCQPGLADTSGHAAEFIRTFSVNVKEALAECGISLGSL